MKDYPVIGQPIPAFKLTDVRSYAKKTFNPQDAQGKWIILDFWYKGCSSCVQSFPKINQLQNEYEADIQFLLIGKNDKKGNGNIEKIYEKFRVHFGWTLAHAFDSTLFDRFKITTAPHVVIIDPQSKVYAVTTSSELNHENLKALVENKNPAFAKKYYDFEKISERAHTVWKYWKDVKKSVPTDFIYRSVLSEYKGEAETGSWSIGGPAVEQGLYHVIGLTLSQLYSIAYWGENVREKAPLLEIRDTSRFQLADREMTGRYNYGLTVPKAKSTKAHLMEVMQRDLKNYFGYEVSIELKMMPCWTLKATAKARETLKTKRDYYYEFEPTGVEGRNVPVDVIFRHIRQYAQYGYLPFIDETGIEGEIDIKFNAVMTDMNDIQRALRENGLILEKSKREIKVLVIRDPKLEDKNN